MARMIIGSKAGHGKITYRANAGIEAKLADLVEKVWIHGNTESIDNPNHFYDGNCRYSVMLCFPDHPEISISKRDDRGYQYMWVEGAYVYGLVNQLREMA